jgi:hypothetical protein
MADNDFNPVRPVENLQNVSGLTPLAQRREGKRRQTPDRPAPQPRGTPPETAAEEQPSRSDSSHTIDYCA